jgi:hypothetical protein
MNIRTPELLESIPFFREQLPMPTTPASSVRSEDASPRLTTDTTGIPSRALAWSSFVFAFLQSICTAVVTINSVRLAIGIGALVMSAGLRTTLTRWHHTDWIRIPMILFALGGSALNLAILIHARRLRNRPAAQWRRVPLTAHEIRMERIQVVLSLATYFLIAVEEYLHFQLCHAL